MRTVLDNPENLLGTHGLLHVRGFPMVCRAAALRQCQHGAGVYVLVAGRAMAVHACWSCALQMFAAKELCAVFCCCQQALCGVHLPGGHLASAYVLFLPGTPLTTPDRNGLAQDPAAQAPPCS